MWTSLASFKYWKHLGTIVGVLALLTVVNMQGRQSANTKWKLKEAEQNQQILEEKIADQKILHESDLSKKLSEAVRVAVLEERERLAAERLSLYEQQILNLKETNDRANQLLIKAQATRPNGNDLLATGVSDILNDYVNRIQSRRPTSNSLYETDRPKVQNDRELKD